MPASNGDNLTGVESFFPSVEPRKIIRPTIPAERTEMTSIPDVLTHSCMPPLRIYSTFDDHGETAQGKSSPGRTPPIKVTRTAIARAAETAIGKRAGAGC